MKKMPSNWVTPKGNPTVKWQGNSILKLRTALSDIGEAANAKRIVVRAMDAQLDAAVAVAKVEVGQLLGIDPAALHLGGSWDCPESPTLGCIYNIVEDRLRDHCLICGDPNERK